MADTKISALAAVTTALGADEIAVNEGGTSKKVTLTQLGNLLTITNASTTSQNINDGASPVAHIITGGLITVPVGKLRIGTILRWTISMTKTAAGTAASTVTMYVGTLGTTSDTAVLTWAKPAGTAAADEATMMIEVVCRGPLTASGIFSGQFTMVHNLSATGHAQIPAVVVNTVSAAFDVTTASLLINIGLTPGASDNLTFQLVAAEALYL